MTDKDKETCMKILKLVLVIPLIFLTLLSLKADTPTNGYISLTAPDGTGLELRDMKVKAVVDGMTAFTEMELTFYNPENRQREGHFSILLPPKATMSRFAMRINDRWQEGEVVETRKARQAYEDFLHRKQDPALLEQDNGNMFRARIFPIPANAEKKLIVSYSELLVNNHATYVFPLKGLPQLKNMSIKVFYKDKSVPTGKDSGVVSSLGGQVKNWQVMSVEKKDYQPDQDFSLSFPSAQKDIYALRVDNMAAVKFQPLPIDLKWKSKILNDWVILYDTSASQALDYEKNLGQFGKILQELFDSKAASSALIIAFDQEVKKIGEITKSNEINTVLSSLKERQALGASNFELAFTELSKLTDSQERRLLIISDGAPTAFETNKIKLSEILSKITSIERTDCLALSTYRNEDFLTALSRASDQAGVVLNGEIGQEAMIKKLNTPTWKEISIDVPGAEWFWPQKLEGLQPGDEIVVFAEIAKDKPFQIKDSFKKEIITLQPELTEKELLKREWVKARIQKLLENEATSQDKDMKSAMHNEIIRLSEKERVLSPYTSLLVLETEWDYQRYKIDRNALADILTIGSDGLTLINRKAEDIPVVQPVASKQNTRVQGLALRKQEATPGEGDLARNGAAPALAEERMEFEEADFKAKEGGSLDAATPAREVEQAVQTGTSSTLNQVAKRSETEDTSELAQQRRIITPPSNPVPSIVSEQVSGASNIETNGKEPWIGDYAQAKKMMKDSDLKSTKEFILQWRAKNPADALALIALGEVEAKMGNGSAAARAYGSLIDLFPSRADIRRWAAERLLEITEGHVLAKDSLIKANEQRKDHPSGYVLLATAEMITGHLDSAINILVAGLSRQYPDRYPQVDRIMKEIIGLILSSKQGQHLLKDESVQEIARKYNINTKMKSQLRFLLTWETDANDVDFHIYDKDKNHAYYQGKILSSGGELYADITQGYGPECFTVENPKAFPYQLQAHYYSRGPMGYGMGLLQIVRLSEDLNLSIENRPFIIMQDQAFVNLGEVA